VGTTYAQFQAADRPNRNDSDRRAVGGLDFWKVSSTARDWGDGRGNLAGPIIAGLGGAYYLCRALFTGQPGGVEFAEPDRAAAVYGSGRAGTGVETIAGTGPRGNHHQPGQHSRAVYFRLPARVLSLPETFRSESQLCRLRAVYEHRDEHHGISRVGAHPDRA